MKLTLQVTTQVLIAQPFCQASCPATGMLATNAAGLHATLALALGLPQG